MSVAAPFAAAFFREVSENRRVWTIRDSSGFPAPQGDGGRAMPFWSSQSRAELIIKNVAAYGGFVPVEIDLAAFMSNWISGLSRDKLRVGINWSGERAMGYDLDPQEVARRLLTIVGPDRER